MQQIIKTVHVSTDGMEFDNKDECIQHERDCELLGSVNGVIRKYAFRNFLVMGEDELNEISRIIVACKDELYFFMKKNFNE